MPVSCALDKEEVWNPLLEPSFVVLLKELVIEVVPGVRITSECR